MSQPNKKRNRDRSDEIRIEVSAKLSPQDEVNVEFSGRLSEQMRQNLQQLRRWLLPAVGSVLVTVVTTILPQLPTPQQPTPPTITPGIDVQQPK